jgi:hypothetical protein
MLRFVQCKRLAGRLCQFLAGALKITGRSRASTVGGSPWKRAIAKFLCRLPAEILSRLHSRAEGEPFDFRSVSDQVSREQTFPNYCR